MKPYTFEVYQSGYKTLDAQMNIKPLGEPNGQWYWRLRASNGKIVADGSEGYSSKSAAKAAVRRVWKHLTEWGVLTWREA